MTDQAISAECLADHHAHCDVEDCLCVCHADEPDPDYLADEGWLV